LKLERVDSIEDPRVEEYRDVRDAELLRSRSLFIVEGRGNLRQLIERSRFRPRSLFLAPPALEALSDVLETLPAGTPVFVAPHDVIGAVAGFDVHRGALAACVRPPGRDLRELLAPPGRPSRIVVLEALSDPDNVGAVFRNAMAFAADAVLMCPRCCDPLYRKAIRVSMGASLCVPSARFDDWPGGLDRLRAAGYRVIALDPKPSAPEMEIGSAGAGLGDTHRRVALLLGGEAHGLSEGALARSDERLRIGMAPGFDSLNVATASGVALHHFFASVSRAAHG